MKFNPYFDPEILRLLLWLTVGVLAGGVFFLSCYGTMERRPPGCHDTNIVDYIPANDSL
jgi:hypothetical protein